jgi:hypothetical protein
MQSLATLRIVMTVEEKVNWEVVDCWSFAAAGLAKLFHAKPRQ